jgi:hypothetical protein
MENGCVVNIPANKLSFTGSVSDTISLKNLVLAIAVVFLLI